IEPVLADLRRLGLTVKFDDRDTHKPGFKFAEHELKGIPVRIAIGPRDLENGTLEVARRDTREKQVVKLDAAATTIPALLEDIQKTIYKRALDFRNQKTTRVETYKEMIEVLDQKGGFVSAHWDGTMETEALIKEETKATIRCIPRDAQEEE